MAIIFGIVLGSLGVGLGNVTLVIFAIGTMIAIKLDDIEDKLSYIKVKIGNLKDD